MKLVEAALFTAQSFPVSALQMLLGRLEAEPEKAVRRAVAAVICSVASHELTGGEWPELLQFVFAAAKHEASAYRELGLMLLGGIMEAMSIALRGDLDSFKPLILSALSDADFRVRVEALKCATMAICGILEPENFMSWADVVDPLLTVVAQCVEDMADGLVCDAFEALTELAESEQPVLLSHLPAVVQLVASVMVNDMMDIGPRRAAGRTLHSLIESRPRAIVKRGLLGPMIKTLADLACSHFDDPELTRGSGGVEGATPEHMVAAAAKAGAEGDSDDALSSQVVSLAGVTLDCMANHMPSAKVWKAATAEALGRVQSQDWVQRRSGLMILSCVTAGCRSHVHKSRGDLIGLYIKLSQDQVPAVRETAFWTLAQTAEYLPKSNAQFSTELLAVINAGLADGNTIVASKAAALLEMFCDAIDEDHVEKAVPQCMAAVGKALARGVTLISHLGLSALASIAVNGGEHMRPHFGDLCHTLLPLIKSTDKSLFSLKAGAIDAMGHLFAAVGGELVQQLLREDNFVPYVYAALQFDDSTLTEAVLAFFGQTAAALKEGFAESVPSVVASLVDTIRNKNNQKVQSRLKHSGIVSQAEDEQLAQLMGQEEQKDLFSVGAVISLHQSQAEVIAQAVMSLGQVAHHAPLAFAPHVSEVLPVISHAATHFHEHIRAHAYTSYQYVLESQLLSEYATKGSISTDTNAAVGEFVYMMANAMQLDEDKDPVAHACDAVQFMVTQPQACQLPSLRGHAGHFAGGCMALLQGQGECQHPDDSEMEDEEDDHDHVLMDAVAETVAHLAKWLGAEYGPIYKDIHPHVLKYAAATRHFGDKSMAFGCLAEVFMFMGAEASAPFVASSLPLAIAALQDASYEVRQNAVFCVGVCTAAVPSASAAEVTQICKLLSAHLKRVDGEPAGVVDNAAGALARIQVAHAAAFPAADFVATVLPVMPLSLDCNENTPVYKVILNALHAKDAGVTGHLAQLMAVFAHDIHEERFVDDETPDALAQVLRALTAAHEQEVVGMLSQLPEEQRATLTAVIQGQSAATSPVKAASGAGR